MCKRGKGKILRKCNECEKEFYARHDRLGKFCSKSCASKTRKYYFRIWKKCEVCLKDFEVKRYRIDSALYCSVECRRKRMPAKENHSKWKGGIARTWKSKVLIKKLIKIKGKCELCYSLNDLQGHHIIPYSVDKLLQENESNIQILCRKCHAQQHPEMKNFILKGLIHE